MENKMEIVICLGSSCFSRGNKKTLAEIQKFLKNNRLEEKVYFHGAHCFGECAGGPWIKINEKSYGDINEYNVIEILNETLL